MMTSDSKRSIAVLGGGCFWCLDAVFRELDGVESVESGYAGGRNANPSYEEVCGGRTGHAEVVRLTFDPAVYDSPSFPRMRVSSRLARGAAPSR